MATVNRDKNGKFVKGNKGGGRKQIPPEIREALTNLIPKSIEKLQSILEASEDDKLVLETIKVILDRVYGKPLQSIESKNENTDTVIIKGEVEEWSK